MTRRTRALIRVLAVITLTALVAVIAIPAVAPCPTEDSSTCLWDASFRGNHQGRSFIDIGGHLFYLQ